MPNASAGPNITDTAQVNTGVITADDIATDAVDSAEIKAQAVGTSEIADLSIVDGDINATAGIVDTKLATISTSGKVSGAALTSLASIPAGAGIIPAANLPSKGISAIFVELKTLAGAFDEVTVAPYRAVNLPNAAATSAYGYFFIPTGFSISSIVMHFTHEDANNGNAVFDYVFSAEAAAGGVQATTDSSVTQVVAIGAAVEKREEATLPATAYDGLTAGRYVTMKITRQGSDGSDTTTSRILVSGVVVTFA